MQARSCAACRASRRPSQPSACRASRSSSRSAAACRGAQSQRPRAWVSLRSGDPTVSTTSASAGRPPWATVSSVGCAPVPAEQGAWATCPCACRAGRVHVLGFQHIIRRQGSRHGATPAAPLQLGFCAAAAAGAAATASMPRCASAQRMRLIRAHVAPPQRQGHVHPSGCRLCARLGGHLRGGAPARTGEARTAML